jgi:hypothetical protein
MAIDDASCVVLAQCRRNIIGGRTDNVDLYGSTAVDAS